jgi:signal transduction histidine kinase
MTPFRADQLILEYQLFRDAICEASRQHDVRFSNDEWRVIEVSIDSAVRDAVREFSLIHEGMRERLAATLSHDMRNPLSLILAGTQLIARSPDIEVARRMAAKIEIGARRIEGMLTQLVDALTFESVIKLPMVLSEFDVIELLHTVAQEFNVASADKIAVLSQPPMVGYWCRNSLHRALENLVTNALKYGDGELVRLKADIMRGRLILSVHNSGNAIAADQRERIFEYLRREGEGNMAQGWGIGLPFVRSVAEGHGGSVAVDSSAASGTTFIIDIPQDCRPFVVQTAT